VTDFQQARRDLLKRLGIGAACLPLLRAGGARADGRPHKKLICVLGIHGYRQPLWKPQALGPLAPQTLPTSTAPLSPYKSDLTFTTGLVHDAPKGEGDYGTIFWGLPDVLGTGLYKEPNGKTLDQVVADAQPGGQGALSLAVQITLVPRASNGAERGAWVCSWRGPGLPVEPREDPVAVYAQLFGAGTSQDPTPVKQLLVRRKSLLDYLTGSLGRYAGRVGTEDRRYLEEHLQSVRALETRLMSTPAAGACGSPPAAIDIADHARYPDVYRAQVDVMMAALACGVTSVVTLQLADASGTSVNLGFVPGIPAKGTGFKTAFRNWHDLAHNPVMNGIDQKAILDTWWMSQFADLLARLKATPDLGGTTMLENSVVLWANTMEDRSNHNSLALPWVLAGQGGGSMRTGLHAASAGQPSSAVLASIARAMDVPGQPFGAPFADILT